MFLARRDDWQQTADTLWRVILEPGLPAKSPVQPEKPRDSRRTKSRGEKGTSAAEFAFRQDGIPASSLWQNPPSIRIPGGPTEGQEWSRRSALSRCGFLCKLCGSLQALTSCACSTQTEGPFPTGPARQTRRHGALQGLLERLYRASPLRGSPEKEAGKNWSGALGRMKINEKTV